MMRAYRTKAVAFGAAVVVSLALSPSASADEDNPVIPSLEAIEAAEQRVTDVERSVGDIQSELFAANDRLEQLGVDAQIASERYNGALLAWQQARTDAAQAQQRAARAADRVKATRAELAGFVLADFSKTSDLTTFGTALGEHGQDQLLNQFSEYSTSSNALGAHYQEWQAASELAKVYRQDAADALQDAGEAKLDADEARLDAEDAVQAQQDAVVSIGVQRDQLIQELAEAQDISVALATERQVALEQRRAERLAEQRRIELLRQQRAEQREQDLIERQQRREERRQQVQQQQEQEQQEQRQQDRMEQRRQDRQVQREQERNRPTRDEPRNDPPRPDPQPEPEPEPEPEPQPQPQPEPQPQPQPEPQPQPDPSGSAQDAIDFAYDQLGEPYVWGAAGPDSWDCSGLTMGAWQAAGVYLPHYSVAQYYATTPVSYSNLRPGDLIFWGSDASNPDTIFHVGLYIGNGQMIHAPRTGKDVELQDVWYWESPDFFGRP